MSSFDEYRTLRERYAACVSTNSDAAAAEEARALGPRLRALAAELGRDPAEVDQLFEYERLKRDYREAALALAATFKYDDAAALHDTLAPKLEEFCLASGNTLSSLTAFYRGVEAAVAETLPK